jgi:hypothetical protein
MAVENVPEPFSRHVQKRPSLLGNHPVQVDDLSGNMRHRLDHRRGDHAGIVMADQDQVAQVLDIEKIRKVIHISVKVDAFSQQMTAISAARQGGRVDLVLLPAKNGSSFPQTQPP